MMNVIPQLTLANHPLLEEAVFALPCRVSVYAGRLTTIDPNQADTSMLKTFKALQTGHISPSHWAAALLKQAFASKLHHRHPTSWRAQSRRSDDEHESAAWLEAAQIYKQATQVSTLQTLAELQAIDAEDEAGSVETPPDETAVVALLQEYGLTSREAASLYKRLYCDDAEHVRKAPSTVSSLAARLERLQRLLPGIDPTRLAVADSGTLTMDINTALRSLIILISFFPGRDVMPMLECLPRLLWLDGLQSQLQQCCQILVRLHPSQDEDIVKDMMIEYPTLVLRMCYYEHALMIDELPLEIQNMMVVADQSLGQTFRYYKNRKTDYQAELSSDEPFEQHT